MSNAADTASTPTSELSSACACAGVSVWVFTDPKGERTNAPRPVTSYSNSVSSAYGICTTALIDAISTKLRRYSENVASSHSPTDIDRNRPDPTWDGMKPGFQPGGAPQPAGGVPQPEGWAPQSTGGGAGGGGGSAMTIHCGCCTPRVSNAILRSPSDE